MTTNKGRFTAALALSVKFRRSRRARARSHGGRFVRYRLSISCTTSYRTQPMSFIDKELKIYAMNGLRTAAGWLTLGRVVESGSPARSSTESHGKLIELFTRDQTQPTAAA